MLEKEKCDLSLYRLQRAKELISDAESLFERASYKSSNNRAYYAVFSCMRAVLALDGEDFKKHSGVIQYFLRNYIKTGIFDKKCSDICFMECQGIESSRQLRCFSKRTII